MADNPLLVEIRCEELPPAQVRALALQFPDKLLAALRQAGFADENSARQSTAAGEPYLLATPRRFAALLNGIRPCAAETHSRRRGPPLAACYDENNAPTKALIGFMKSVGVTDPAALVEITEKGRGYIACDERGGGEALADTLAGMVESILLSITAPRLMRWGDNDFKFIRPLRGILFLYGNQPLPGKVFGITADTASRGHPTLAPAPLPITAADTYIQQLADKGAVLVDISRRRKAIAAQFNNGAAQPDSLLDEVTAMCEQPVVYRGTLGEQFLALPDFCVRECMIKHQRAFPVYEKDTLTAAYHFVADNRPPAPANMINGMDTVLRARLSDVAFYIREDKQLSLAEALRKLEQVVYHHRLGHQRTRVVRLCAISERLGAQFGLSAVEQQQLEQAALVCKSDLPTLMINEYPELEGLMAAYYFCPDDADVAALVCRHNRRDWQEAATDFVAPAPFYALLLALNSEKLAGMFAADEKPSGSKDPHGLRTAAAIVAGILDRYGYRLTLDELLQIAADEFSVQCPVPVTDLKNFIRERKRQELLEKSYPAVTLNAVLALPQPYIADIEAKAAALRDFMQQPEAGGLIEAYKRISNILRKSSDELPPEAAPDSSLLEAGAESALHDALLANRQYAAEAPREYQNMLTRIAAMRGVIGAFFDEVLVNHTDTRIRHNRLTLLRQLRDLFNTVGDLSKLAGG